MTVPTDRKKWEAIFGLSVLSFLVMFTYALVRPPVESYFIEMRGSESLPKAWLAVSLLAMIVVSIYSRLVARFDLLKLLGFFSAVSAVLFVFLWQGCLRRFPFADYLLYAWKDVYIVVLVEIFYSYANSVFPIKTARWAYGFFGVVAAMSGMLGNLVVGSFAVKFGSVSSILVCVPVLISIALFCFPMARVVGLGVVLFRREKGGMMQAGRVVFKSSYLLFLLFVVLCFQTAMTLADFSFNRALESAYPIIDQRTVVIGKIYAVVNALTFVLQALTGPILRIMCAPALVISIPILLLLGTSAFVLFPAFAVISFVKIAGKGLDYTLFRNSKEILYIPLSYEEKTLGKSAVDMLGLRLSKGLASFILMLLVMQGLDFVVPLSASFVCMFWLLCASVIAVRFRKKIPRKKEILGSS